MNQGPKFTRREFDEIMSWNAARLIENGEMPSREEFLAAVAKARTGYSAKIRAARRRKKPDARQARLF